ncbi:hypothetical protein KPH14_004599 [Odynerus spinipes]|uniref:Uncharacterized protein n=1 Tax=Odynerus spinipes TaxID=1348599 RepID=A0AAD9RMB7_9HYME|nr:hypothetical protein KPH14_004599 [Odynerus spinipes]
MRWQLGGDLEPVKIICETDWRQCPRAILKYIWTEVVTDVVDCLITEETVWRIIAVLIVCIILLRTIYVKRKCANKAAPVKDTLNRVGCKVEDLELKINILTYKLQYGTWPLPHQIRNPALRKQLRNLRLTLSTSSDRNTWIKRMLLSSTTDGSHLTPPTFDSTSVQRMTELFDTKTGYVSSDIHRDITPTDYSDMKTSKTSSAESIKQNSLESNNQRGLSKSENLGTLHRIGTRLSLLPRQDSVVECSEKRKAQNHKRSKFSTSQSRLTPCDRYTESLHECKRFLRELKDGNKKLELDCSSSSAISNVSSVMKETYTDDKVISIPYNAPEAVRSIELEFITSNEQNRIISGDVTFCLLKSSLHAQTTDAKNASGRCELVGGVEKMQVKVEREEKNLKAIMDREIVYDASNDVPETYGITSSSNSNNNNNNNNNNGLVPSLNLNVHDDLPRNFPIDSLTNIVLPQSDNVIQMSRETLYQIKRKLESLDNVLRAYGMLNSRTRSIEESKENGADVRAIYRNVIDTLDTIKVEIENINEIRKNKVSFDFNVKEYSDKMLQTTSSDCDLFGSSSSKSDKSSTISIRSYSKVIVPPIEDSLATIAQRNHQRAAEESTKIDAAFTQSRCSLDLILDHEPVLLDDSKKQETRTYVKTLSDFSTRKIILSRRKIEELSEFPAPMETDEDPSTASTTSSQLEVSKDSDLENKSTAMLLREALQCKKELLSRVKLQKFYSNIELGQSNENYMDNFKNDNAVCPDADRTFPSKLLDIIAEEQSTSSCTDKTSRTYIFLQMKQPTGELSDRSVSSLNMEFNDGKQENIKKRNENFEFGVKKLSKQAIPVVSSQYFSFEDFTIDSITDNRLRDFREVRNIILEEIPSDDEQASFDQTESITNATSSSRGKRRHKEIARCEDDDTDDNRKKLCHRDNVEKPSTSYARLRKARSVQEPCHKRGNNVRIYSDSVSKIRNLNELLQENVSSFTDSVEFFTELHGNMIIKDEQTLGESDDFLWDPTTESSSGGSTKHRFIIDNGSMTNFLSSTDSNVEMIKYPCIVENDNKTPWSQDLSLKRRPGTFSFAHLEMNTLFADDSDLFIRNPYFLAETTLSESTCKESIEVNLIPISVSSAIIDSRDSSIFTMARSNILRDITDVTSTLRICYDDDLENGNITEIIENEVTECDRNETRVMQSVESIDHSSDCGVDIENPENDEKSNVMNEDGDSVEDTEENQIEKQPEQLEFTEIQADSMELQHTDVIDANTEDLTKSRSNVISEQSSTYFTGDTSSSTNKLDTESFYVSTSNIEEDLPVREIDIQTEILESCIDSCVDLLKSRERDNTNDTPLQMEDATPVDCSSDNNDASNKTSASYVDANIFPTVDDNVASNAPIDKQAQKRSEGLFFDGSIRYKKPSVTRSAVQPTKKSPPLGTTSSIKPKPTRINTRAKSTISGEPASRKGPKNNSQLKAKSNLSIICDNKKELATNSAKSCTRPSSCNLSRERSRFYITSRRSESSSRSAAVSQSEDQLKGEETIGKAGRSISEEKPKSGTHSKHSLLSPKSFSKSCIPILKRRLDARRTDQTSRPKSPMRGPLTMTGSCRNKIDNNAQGIGEDAMPTEGSPTRKEESQQHLHDNHNKTTQETTEADESRFIKEPSKESTNVIDENCGSVVPREQTVIYVNIVQQHDHNVTRILNPEKFLEYAKGESIVEDLDDSGTKLQSAILPKIVTIVSSVSNEADMNSNNDNSSANLHISTGTLKSLWSVTIQQKETEVTAKPSVTDMSTSISDLQQTTETMKEHRIFGIPKELTNEEYSKLLEILTQKTNIANLKEIQNLCNRLRLRNETLG